MFDHDVRKALAILEGTILAIIALIGAGATLACISVLVSRV